MKFLEINRSLHTNYYFRFYYQKRSIVSRLDVSETLVTKLLLKYRKLWLLLSAYAY